MNLRNTKAKPDPIEKITQEVNVIQKKLTKARESIVICPGKVFKHPVYKKALVYNIEDSWVYFMVKKGIEISVHYESEKAFRKTLLDTGIQVDTQFIDEITVEDES